MAPTGRAAGRLLRRHGRAARTPPAPGPGAETGSRRFATGAYGFWHAHVRALVVDAGGEPVAGQGRLDAQVDALLAPLAPELHQHQRDRGRSPAGVTAALTHLARAVLGRPDGDRGTA